MAGNHLMPPLLQVLTLLFATAMVYLTYVGFRRRQFGLGGLIFWEIVWIGLLVISVLPSPLQPLSRVLGAARVLDLVMVIAVLLLAAITYRNYVTVQVVQRQLQKLVRREALANARTEEVEPKATSPPTAI